MAKYKAYPEYKDSGVEWLGRVPKHWNAKSLKFLCTFNDQVISESAGHDYEIEYVDIGSVNSSQGITKTETMLLSKAPSRARRLVKDGDVIISTVRTYLEAISPIINPPDNMVVSTGFAVIRPSIGLNHAFAAYCLRASGFIKEVVARSVGVSYPAINASDLVNIPVPNMPLTEQLRIANFLDHETAKIDNLIEKQQQLIELLKEKRQAVISHAVTKGLNPDVPMKDSGVEWLGEVPEHWKICRIKQLSKQISKGTTPSTIGGDFVDEGIRFLKAENIGKSKFVNSLPEFYISNDVDKQISRSRLQERDVLVIIAGATTGMASVLQKEILPANTNQAVSFIRTKNINHADWIYYWLGTDIIQRIIGMGAVQAAQPNLSMEDLGNIPILLPEQDELASICIEIEKQFVQFESLICKAESAIDLMQERRTALISAAVTGKIDVRDWVARDTQDIEAIQEATA
ncbi:restriction endonuclease subunit S [Entomohabitans teleogrylli]|uniref:restriction endonuclease subunit S n=1 Tax=Entomohabitans teleogrylli TaxID=1384589 RepID=UPI00073D26DA|nr:restriction endonuclease subunit S [Entomohabitans teleogrylli]